ncbi:MAG: glycosyltransferase family 4 protein [Deltaproteobacteria bacterium]|nr:glycosyltransferase family 4 protein [Deltaproteobacteria bacterium]
MIRLAELTPNFGTGGIETRVARVVGSLSPDEFTVTWAGFAPPDPGLRAIAGPQVGMHEFKKRRSRLHLDLRLVGELALHFRRFRPDVVRVHNYATSAYGIAASRLAGVPQVIYETAGREHPEGPSLRQVALLRALGTQVDVVLSVCEFLAAEARASFGLPKESVRVMPTGVDLDLFSPLHRPATRARFGLPEGAFVFGTIGIFRSVKRVEDVVEAGVKVLAQHPEAYLLVVGVDESHVVPDAYWAAARAAGVAERCRFPGRLPAQEAAGAFDVFINASTFEGASNAIIEAMATGAAIVATSVGGNPDVVEEGKTGFLVPPQDPAAIESAVLRLAEDRALHRRIAEEARRVAATRHRISTMVQAYADLFRELARRPARTPAREAAATVQGILRGLSAYRSLRGARPAGRD